MVDYIDNDDWIYQWNWNDVSTDATVDLGDWDGEPYLTLIKYVLFPNEIDASDMELIEE